MRPAASCGRSARRCPATCGRWVSRGRARIRPAWSLRSAPTAGARRSPISRSRPPPASRASRGCPSGPCSRSLGGMPASLGPARAVRSAAGSRSRHGAGPRRSPCDARAAAAAGRSELGAVAARPRAARVARAAPAPEPAPARTAHGRQRWRGRAGRRLLLVANLPGSGSQIYRHPGDGRPLQVFATPLAWPAHLAEARARFHRAIFIGDPRNRTGDPVDILIDLYGLTVGEARLALLLLSDRSLEQAAQQLGIALSTARSHLKSLFAKTDTNRQASLVRLLLSGPGQLRAPTPDAHPRGRRRRRPKP